MYTIQKVDHGLKNMQSDYSQDWFKNLEECNDRRI